jgi:hypothetical protein
MAIWINCFLCFLFIGMKGTGTPLPLNESAGIANFNSSVLTMLELCKNKDARHTTTLLRKGLLFDELLAMRGFPDQLIITTVPWYCTYYFGDTAVHIELQDGEVTGWCARNKKY